MPGFSTAWSFPLAKLNEVQIGANWRVTLLADRDPGPLPAQIETLETKARRRLSLPTYCEAPLDRIIGRIREDPHRRHYAGRHPSRSRFGGVSAPGRRSPSAIQSHSRAAPSHPRRDARLRQRFRCGGVCLARDGPRIRWSCMLEETDAPAFEFGATGICVGAAWRFLPVQICAARRDFAHSFGSCSFEEPLEDLRELGWMPGWAQMIERTHDPCARKLGGVGQPARQPNFRSRIFPTPLSAGPAKSERAWESPSATCCWMPPRLSIFRPCVA